MTATAPYEGEVLRNGNPKASRDRNRATNLPNRFTHSLRSLVHPLSEHALTSLRSLDSRLRRSSSRTPFSRPRPAHEDLARCLLVASALLRHTRKRARAVAGSALRRATRGKAGKRLAFGVALYNPLTQSPNTQTNNPKATRGKAGKRLAVGLTFYNTLTQPAGINTPRCLLSPTKSTPIQSLRPLRRMSSAIATQTITSSHSACVTKHDHREYYD